MSMVNEVRVVAMSQMAVSSMPPMYPPNIGICSTMMTLPLCSHPAIMLRDALSIFSSLSCDTSWLSQGRNPPLESLARRPATDSGVSGPYMPMSGRPARLQASRMARISASVALISNGVLVVDGMPSMVAMTPLTMVSTTGSCA